MKEIWEDHNTWANLPPCEVSIDPGDRSGRYKPSSQGVFHPEDALCSMHSNSLISQAGGDIDR